MSTRKFLTYIVKDCPTFNVKYVYFGVTYGALIDKFNSQNNFKGVKITDILDDESIEAKTILDDYNVSCFSAMENEQIFIQTI